MTKIRLLSLLAALLCASVTTTVFAGAPGIDDPGIDVEPSYPADVNNPVAYVINAYSQSTPYATFAEAVSVWTSGTTLKLLADVEVSSSIVLDSKGSISLDLNGYGIKYTGSVGSVFELASTQLTLIDSNPTASHKYTVANAVEGAGLATINDELSSGYTFLYGGYITGGKGRVGVGYYDEEIGGGAFILYSSDASLTMEAGTLIGNQSNENGGAILIYSGTVTLNGGAIQNNYSAKYGGGVSVRAGSTLNLYGGQIIYNTATYNGGGVFTDITMGSVQLNMHGHPEVRFNYVGTQRENVYLANSYDGHVKINIDGELTGYYSMSPTVGITIENKSAGSHVVTYGFRQNGGHYEGYEYDYPNSPDYYFFSDYPFFYVNWEPGGYGYSNEVALTFQKATLPAPSGVVNVNGLVYDGTSQVLVDASNAVIPEGAILQYSFSRTADYSATLPAKTDAGSWSVYYRAYPASGYESLYNPSSYNTILNCSIAKAPITQEMFTAPTPRQLTYNGNPQNLVTPGTTQAGQMEYTLNGSTGYQAGIPQAIAPGTYRVHYGVNGGNNYSGNYSDSYYVDVTIDGPDAITWNDDVDNSVEMSQLDGYPVAGLTINRAVTRAGDYNTICMPFSLSAGEIAASPLAEFIIQEFTGISVLAQNGGLMKLNVRNTNHIEAGVPYLMRYDTTRYGKPANLSSMTFSNVEIDNTIHNVATDLADYIGTLNPSEFPLSDPNYLFVAANNVLKWSTLTDRIKAFRAYFHIKAADQANSPVRRGMTARIVEHTEVATDIDRIIVNEEGTIAQKVLLNGQMYILREDKVYTVDGQLVK